MAKIIVIVGHARRDTFCEALATSYCAGAREAGHQVSCFVTSKMAFDPILHEGFDRVQPLEPDLRAAHDALVAADHIVIIFPLWLGALPAILKGFLERVLQEELVASSKTHAFPKLLKGKSARLVVTMGMPAILYRLWFHSYALKTLKRNILGFLGAGPVHTLVYGNIEGAGVNGRARWLLQMEALGRQAK